MVHEISDDNFQSEVEQSTQACVIKFTGSWCTLCSKLEPVFEELSKHYGDKVKFCTVNTDEQKKLRIKFAVVALPYIVYVHDGKKTPLFDELVSKERLRERIDFMLDGGDAPTTMPL